MEDNKIIDKILSVDERMVLLEMMGHPGWGILKKINRKIKEDWINQTADFDMSGKNDEEMIRILRHRQGQIVGMSLVIRYLEKKLVNTKSVQEK